MMLQRRPLILTSLSVFLYGASLAGAASAQDDSSLRLRSFSLSHWHHSSDSVPYPPTAIVPRPGDWEPFEERSQPERYAEGEGLWLGLSFDEWSWHLDRLLEIRSDSGPELEVLPDRRSILALGTEPQLEHLRQSLLALEQALLRTVDIRVTVLEFDPKDAPDRLPVVLSRSDAEDLRARYRTRIDRVERILAGHHHKVLDERSTPFVRDYEVEVARTRSIADPRMDLLVDGTRIWLVADETFDQRLFLDVRFEHGARDEEIARRVTGAATIGVLDTPVLRETWASFHAPIEPEETLAFWSVGTAEHGPSFVVLFEARSVPETAPELGEDPGPFLRRLPIGSLRKPTRLGGQEFRHDLPGGWPTPSNDGPEPFPELLALLSR